MSLTSGTRLGAYEVVALLGAGGMGEVYRARDTKLGRSVAIKILPDLIASDPERVARFDREAKVLASLNHSNIAALYGVDEADSRHFLVMELVEGETLQERLARGPLSIEDALPIARQIAEALEAAHEQGIVHRDLKPANVKITPDDKVKVLDFGLAKAMETAPAAANMTNSPTLSMMASQAGLILGTAGYMSPEQAKGLPADQRSDVFSFGVVLYEMLIGRQPFLGDTGPDILASVLAREPDLAALPRDLNPRVHDLIKRCLEKHQKKRWQAIGDMRAELETIAAAPRASALAGGTACGPPRPLWKRAIPIVATAIVAAAAAGAGTWFITRPSPPPLVRFPIVLPENQRFGAVNRHIISVSPDGARLVYVANVAGQGALLVLRSMNEMDGRMIATTSSSATIASPFFSPDGEWIGFWTSQDRALKKVSVSGGAPVTLCPADIPFGATWDGDSIIFGQGPKGVFRVSANGGQPELIAAPKPGETLHGPQLIDGGRTLLYSVTSAPGEDRWDKAKSTSC